MVQAAAEAEAGATTLLCELPTDCLARLMLLLKEPADIVNVGRTCRKLWGAACDNDRVWRVLCTDKWGEHTDVPSWLAASDAPCALGLSSTPSVKPATYRQLYPVLRQHEACVGLWTCKGAGPRGSLYHFRWGADCIECFQLNGATSFSLKLPRRLFCRLGPGHSGFSAEILDDTHCLVREWHGGSPARPAMASRAAAEAAAAAAQAGSSPPPGSSPASSFGAELMRFMQGSVEARGRRSKRASSGTGAQPQLHHFVRLNVPRRSRQHPLAGLWKGLYGPHGLEVLSLCYDFSGSTARIVATKVTGDATVPAGERSWTAPASPLPQPWGEREERLILERALYAALSAAAVAHWQAEAEEGEEAAGQQQQQQPADELQQQPQPDNGSASTSAQAQGAGAGRSPAAVKVVATYAGQGRVAEEGFESPAWVEGRLWVYDSGRIGFLWQEQFGFLIDYVRLDEDLY